LYAPNITIIALQRFRWVGHVVRVREEINVYRILILRPKHRREDKTEMDLLWTEFI
jgi:hypothetical protein